MLVWSDVTVYVNADICWYMLMCLCDVVAALCNMGPIWADRTQVGPLLSGVARTIEDGICITIDLLLLMPMPYTLYLCIGNQNTLAFSWPVLPTWTYHTYDKGDRSMGASAGYDNANGIEKFMICSLWRKRGTQYMHMPWPIQCPHIFLVKTNDSYRWFSLARVGHSAAVVSSWSKLIIKLTIPREHKVSSLILSPQDAGTTFTNIFIYNRSMDK